MTEKKYRVAWGPWRVKLSIGTKTLLAFLLIISFLAGWFYYFTTVKMSDRIEKEAMSDLNLKLKGSWKLFYQRMEQMKMGMLQAGSERIVKDAVQTRDGRFLNDLMNNFAKARPYVDLWTVVDADKKVIARRSGKSGDALEINGIIEKALNSGVPILSVEDVSADVLGREGEELASRVDGSGLMQVVVTPVKSGDKVLGAFVTGILLNKNQWFPDSVYESFHVSSAILDSTHHEAVVIASSEIANSVFNNLSILPEEITKTVLDGKKFLGGSFFEGSDVYMAVEPITNSEGRVIGALAAGIHDSEIKRTVRSMEANIFIIAGIGVVFSLVLAGITYIETTKPINVLAAAMDEMASGNLDVRVEIKTKDDFERIGDGLNKMIESIQVRERRLDRFNELSKILIESQEPEELLQKALTRMVELTNSHLGIVYVFDERRESLSPVVSYGVSSTELRELNIGEGVAGKCAEGRKTIVLRDIGAENIPLEVGFSSLMPKGLVWFPMLYKEKLNGVFTVGSLHAYNHDEIKHIERLVTQIAIALDNALTHKEIERLSLTDPLTSLYNRRYFFERLENDFAKARRHKHSVAVLMIDIDNFKQINDIYGHQQGDLILSDLSRILKEKTRATDLWARYGGEEFIGYVSHSAPEGVLALAEKLRKSVETYAFPGMGGKPVTVSIGIGYYPDDPVKDIEEFVKTADENLYQAKRSGKNMAVCSARVSTLAGVIKAVG